MELNYRGKVTCKLKVGNKIIQHTSHNNGSDELFRIIAKALAGYSITQEKPMYLDLSKTADGTSLLKQNAILTGGAFLQEDGNWVTVYDAQISKSMIDSNAMSDIEASDKIYARLISVNSEILAYTQLSNTDNNNIAYTIYNSGNNTQALLQWKMYITNPT